jgi:hypothetical protein
MADQSTYTDEQKEELSRMLAEALHDALQGARPAKVGEMAKRLLAEARKLGWFRNDENKNEYSTLRHLEEAGVYGAFDFFPDKLATLYLRAIFESPFQDFVRQARPSKQEFVRRFGNKKFSRARKPSHSAMLGDTSANGGNRQPNMRGMLSGR